jgi:hypothetical protein
MQCPHCGKPLLTPDQIGFMPGVKWVHICDIPKPANDESKQ